MIVGFMVDVELISAEQIGTAKLCFFAKKL